MLRTCDFCGRRYEAKRKTSKYCCATCRKRANAKAAIEERCVLSAPAAIDQTRETMHLLDVLSVNGPDAYREICGHLSRSIADAMSELGL